MEKNIIIAILILIILILIGYIIYDKLAYHKNTSESDSCLVP